MSHRHHSDGSRLARRDQYLRQAAVEALETRVLLSATGNGDDTNPNAIHRDPTLKHILSTGAKWRNIQGHNGPGTGGNGDIVPPPPPGPGAPALGTTIEGINFDENAALN